MKNLIKRLSLFVTVVLTFALSTQLVFATGQISLKASNVTVWPTATGELYYGQKLGEYITLSGGEVQYNGVVVPGHFEHIDPDAIAECADNAYTADIKFVPDDTTAYKGFNKLYSKTTFTVHKTTPVFLDKENDPIIATEVEPGAMLSTSSLSGGKCINPYYPEEQKVLAKSWVWSNPNTIVNKSGFYEAMLSVNSSYVVIREQVYVKVAGEIPETVVSEMPTIADFSYDPSLTWKDVEIVGGKAILAVEGTEVEGTFAVDKVYKDITPTVGNHNLPIVFTPADPEAALPYSFKIPVTVNKGTVKFVDESGEEIVPEITLPYGFKVGDDLNGYLKEYLNVSASFNYTETEGYGELIVPGTHEYEVKTSSSDKNFEGTTLKFKVTVNQAELELKVKDVVGGKQIYIEGGDTYHLNGNFDVKYFIDGKEAGTIEGVKFNETFEVKQDKSGVYTYEIVYNEAENDPYKVTKVTVAADDIKLQHSVKINGNEPVVYTYGEKVTVTAPAHEKPYYVFTGWGNSAFAPAEDDGEVVDTITFSMPDEDVELEATYEFSIKAFFEYIFSLIVDFFAKIAEFLQLQKVCDFFAGIFAV